MRHGLEHGAVDVEPRTGGPRVTGGGAVLQAQEVDGWWAAAGDKPLTTSDESQLPWVLAPERPAS